MATPDFRGSETVLAPPSPPAEGFAVLSRQRCLDSMGAAGVGRVAVNADGVPRVLPVRFAVAGEDLVFSPLFPSTDVTGLRNAIVALETDAPDPDTGWSVVVAGVAREIPGPGRRTFRLGTETVSGRQILRPPLHVVGAGREPAPPTSGPGGDDRPPAEEWVRLLARQEVGRLAVLVDGEPRVFPVNYALDGDAVVFRTAPGTKLHAVSRSLVAFEVDQFDLRSMTGWAVMLEGIAQEVTSADAPGLRQRLAQLPLHPWAGGDRNHFVRILATSVTAAAI